VVGQIAELARGLHAPLVEALMAKVACLVGPEFEDAELALPVKVLRESGHEVELLGTASGQFLTGRRGNLAVTSDAAVVDRQPDGYDALLLPGFHSRDLRRDREVLAFVRAFAATGRPIAAVSSGLELLVDAAVMAGVRVAAGPSVATALRNAGAVLVDAAVVEDRQFTSSGSPEHLEAFAHAVLARVDALGGTSTGPHETSVGHAP
jgi:protease I